MRILLNGSRICPLFIYPCEFESVKLNVQSNEILNRKDYEHVL